METNKKHVLVHKILLIALLLCLVLVAGLITLNGSQFRPTGRLSRANPPQNTCQALVQQYSNVMIDLVQQATGLLGQFVAEVNIMPATLNPFGYASVNVELIGYDGNSVSLEEVMNLLETGLPAVANQINGVFDSMASLSDQYATNYFASGCHASEGGSDGPEAHGVPRYPQGQGNSLGCTDLEWEIYGAACVQ